MARTLPRNRNPNARLGTHREYMRLTTMSQGFDTVALARPPTGVILEQYTRRGLRHAKKVARFAVDHYNRTQNADLVFEDLVKANGQLVSGFLLFITLKARTGNESKIYKAKVLEKNTGEKVVKFFLEASELEVIEYHTPEPSDSEIGSDGYYDPETDDPDPDPDPDPTCVTTKL